MMGQTIHDYRVTELVGSGGMGVVYRAPDLKLSRMVALNFLHMNPAPTPTAIDRFMRKLYEDKLKDKTRARDVNATVPTSSSHYSDAQKKLR